MKCSLGISKFLEEISSLHWSLRKAFSSLFAILWNSAFKWVYLSFSSLPLASLLFSAICKASSDNHFAFLHFFLLGMVLITAGFTVSGTSIHSSSGSLSDLIPWIYLPLPLYNRQGIWFIKKRWQEYTDQLYNKDLHDPYNHDGMVIHLDPDIMECEVNWALGKITRPFRYDLNQIAYDNKWKWQIDPRN